MSKCKGRLRKYVRRIVTTINTKQRSRVKLNDCRYNFQKTHQVKRKFEKTPIKTIQSPYKISPMFHPSSKSPSVKRFKSTGKLEKRYSKYCPNKAVGFYLLRVLKEHYSHVKHNRNQHII